MSRNTMGGSYWGKNGAILYVKDSENIIRKVSKPLDSGFLGKKGKLIRKEKDLEKRYINEVLKIIGKKSVKQIRDKKFKLIADPNGGPVIGLLQKLF